MSELQDAIDYFDGKKRKVPPEGHFPVVLEAARLVANPNIEAMAENLNPYVPSGGQALKLARQLWAAAHTPGDTDGT